MSIVPGRPFLRLVLAGTALASALAMAHAQQQGTVRIEKTSGFGRMVFHFDDPVQATVSVSGSVLVISFDRPVKLPVERLPVELSAYVAGVRADPDQRALRIALSQAVTADLKDAAEDLYLDLLPKSWRGAPPPLPSAVVGDLARRTRAAREAIRQAQQQPQKIKPETQRITATVARGAGRIRLGFVLPDAGQGNLDVRDGVVTIAFDGPVTLDEPALRAALAGEVAGLSLTSENGPRLRFTMPDGRMAQSGQDGAQFFVDLLPTASAPRADAVKTEPSASSPGPPAPANAPSVQAPSAASHDVESLKTAVTLRPAYAWMEPERWSEDRRGSMREGERALIHAAASAPKRDRTAARLRLAGFYLGNGLTSEALGVLTVAASDDPALSARPEGVMMRALAHLMAGQDDAAAKLLALPMLASDAEAALWRSVVRSRAMKHADALAGFREGQPIIDRSPEPLKVMLCAAALDTALAMGARDLAAQHLSDLEQLPPDLRPQGLIDLYQARMAEAEGHTKAALAGYQTAAKSPMRPIEAEGRFGAALLAHRIGEADAETTIAALETLAMIWRRDGFEVRVRFELAKLYAAASRWRDAFAQSRRSIDILPDHPLTRALQDDMGRRFEALLRDDGADSLPKIQALAIFDEFRALAPMGPRGDDLARKLAERLYDVDLIDQAAALLAYQVQNRLKGAARAEAAARLAVMYLEAGKPQDALLALRATRMTGLEEPLRRARVLLEARILSELSRHELALEVVAAEQGADAEALRADIHWRARDWQQAAETYERALADRWQATDALTEPERGSLIRAAVAYVLAADRLGLDRLRGKYLPRMTEGPDAATFAAISADNLANPEAFRDAARSAISAKTLGMFLDAYRKRYSGEARKPAGQAG